MVLKPNELNGIGLLSFESSVNSDGTQTATTAATRTWEFESSVNSDGTQTLLSNDITPTLV